MSTSDDSKSPPPGGTKPPSPPDDDAGTAKTVQMTSLPPELQRHYGVGEPQQARPDPSLSTQPQAGQGGQAPLPPSLAASQPPSHPPPPHSAPAQPPPAQQPFPPPSQAPAAHWQPPGPQAQALPPAAGPAYPSGPPGPGSAPATGAGAGASIVQALKSFAAIHVRRSSRLQLSPDDVLPAERQALEQASPPVADPQVQAFLTWRRSLLTVVAVLLVPVTLLSGLELFTSMDDSAGTLNVLLALQWLVMAIFAVACWVLLRSWTAWARQRKLLFRLWLVFFLAPFVVFLFPFRSLLGRSLGQQALVVGMVMSIVAVLTLAPKALSLMPGLIRASVVAKVLFPGAAAPGWLMALAGPIYALIVYVILLTPYQLTGNALFVPAMIGLIGAPLYVAKAGYELARPMEPDEALALVRRARRGYYGLTIGGLFFLFIALLGLVSELDIGWLSAVNLILSLLINVLLLGLIGTDLLLVSLDRARGISGDPAAERLRRSYDQRLERFLSETPGTRLSQAMRAVTGPPPGKGPPPPPAT